MKGKKLILQVILKMKRPGKIGQLQKNPWQSIHPILNKKWDMEKAQTNQSLIKHSKTKKAQNENRH